MKKFLLLFALVGFASFAVQAQTCCSKSAKGATSEASCSSSAAAKAASLDDSIEKRVDNNTGKVTYVRRSVDASTGQATYIPVEYSAETKQFVNESPVKKADCSKEEKAGCHGEGKASTTSADSKTPACCANGTATSGSACCTKESSSKTSSTSVKLIKSQE